ncbi:MAG: acyltransferase [Clostridiales bacterium]|nr:acyltransferase [Clostridiales bacterium]
MKAFGIALVVIAHCISFYTDYIAVPSRTVLLIGSYCYSVNVAVFFVLAGYLCHPQAIGQYYIKKIKSILIPFVLFSFLKIFYSLFITDRFVHADTPAGMLRDAFLEGRLYWFIYTILLMFLIAPVFWKKERAVLTSLVLIGVTLLNTYLFLTGKTDAVLLLQINNFLVFLPFFLTGILLGYIPAGRLPDILHRRRGIKITVSVILTVLMSFLYIRGEQVLLPRELVYPVRFLAAFPLMYLICEASAAISVKTELIRLNGRYSLQIMLMDSFFRVVIYEMLRKLLPEGEYMIWIVAVLDLTVCVAVAAVCSKIPLVSFLLGLKHEKKAPDKASCGV